MRTYFTSISHKQIKFRKKFRSIFRGLCNNTMVFATILWFFKHVADYKIVCK